MMLVIAVLLCLLLPSLIKVSFPNYYILQNLSFTAICCLQNVVCKMIKYKLYIIASWCVELVLFAELCFKLAYTVIPNVSTFSVTLPLL